jgi:hypothetical protein
MADFDKHVLDLFGWVVNHNLTDAEWALIYDHGDFFGTMPLMEDALLLLNSLPQQPVVITACPKTSYRQVARQKRRWVREYLHPDLFILPVMGGHNKPLFMHRPGDILIDDYGKNCRAWEDEGGIAIKHTTATDTLEKLNAIW